MLLKRDQSIAKRSDWIRSASERPLQGVPTKIGQSEIESFVVARLERDRGARLNYRIQLTMNLGTVVPCDTTHDQTLVRRANIKVESLISRVVFCNKS